MKRRSRCASGSGAKEGQCAYFPSGPAPSMCQSSNSPKYFPSSNFFSPLGTTLSHFDRGSNASLGPGNGDGEGDGGGDAGGCFCATSVPASSSAIASRLMPCGSTDSFPKGISTGVLTF
jgi:hypothetical protein